MIVNLDISFSSMPNYDQLDHFSTEQDLIAFEHCFRKYELMQ